MDRGHVKLWRKSLDSGILQSPNLWTFWTWCLMKATWKEHEVIVNMQIIKLKPGQFVFGRLSASKELKMSEQIIRTCVKKLVNMKNLTIKSTNKYSIISIINWDVYQYNQQTTNQQINQQLTNSQPAANHIQERKERKERKEGKEKESVSAPDALDSFKNSNFQKPTIDEIRSYCLQRKNGIDPDSFFHFYESKNWMIGKNKMKKWQSAIITWEKKDRVGNSNKQTINVPEYGDFNFEELR